MNVTSRVVSSAVLLGCGMGALFDGIVLHHLLQWHNMLSSVVPPTDLVSVKYNMLWDGVFHAAAWLVTAAGVLGLWRAVTSERGEARGGVFAGGLLIGWGAFNVLEGLLDHHVLELHHVRPGPNQLSWDIAFLVWGATMLALGGLLLSREQRGSRRSKATHHARHGY